MRDVQIDAMKLDRLAALLEPARAERLLGYASLARELLDDRRVWNLNATAQGGGVAEMLQALLAYGRGAGVDTRWLVLDGDPEFFTITKRLHNFLHGSPGDGGTLGHREREHYQQVLDENLETVRQLVGPRDIVLLHDPQTAGMVEGLKATGARVVWRCHVGRDEPNFHTDVAWDFLRQPAEGAHGFIFSRRQYAPVWADDERLRIIAPSLDPFSAKNAPIDESDVARTLRIAGLVDDTAHPGGQVRFHRRDGRVGQVRRHEGLVLDQGPLPDDARVVLQVSRWDHLKDMAGVMRGFVDNIASMPEDTHLLLVGPDVLGVSDDPEGAAVLEECRGLWRTLAPGVRERVHLSCLPMDDVDENAFLVNALQRYATVVVQKSLVEGFGLTVTEPMWKGRAVVASAVGGIRDQIDDGVSGLLLSDPTDLDAYAAALSRLLRDEEERTRLGTAAESRVRDSFLGDRHLIQYVDLFSVLLASEGVAAP